MLHVIACSPFISDKFCLNLYLFWELRKESRWILNVLNIDTTERFLCNLFAHFKIFSIYYHKCWLTLFHLNEFLKRSASTHMYQVAALCSHRCWGRITLISIDSLPRGRLSDFSVVRQPPQDNTRSPTRSSASETCPIFSKPCCLSGFYDICLWELIKNRLESLVEEKIDGQIHIPRHSQSCSEHLFV